MGNVLEEDSTVSVYENEIDNNKYTVKILGKKHDQAPSRNRTHDFPVTSLDALTTELWATHPVLIINNLFHFHSIGWLADSLKVVLLAKNISVGPLALADGQVF